MRDLNKDDSPYTNGYDSMLAQVRNELGLKQPALRAETFLEAVDQLVKETVGSSLAVERRKPATGAQASVLYAVAARSSDLHNEGHLVMSFSLHDGKIQALVGGIRDGLNIKLPAGLEGCKDELRPLIERVAAKAVEHFKPKAQTEVPSNQLAKLRQPVTNPVTGGRYDGSPCLS